MSIKENRLDSAIRLAVARSYVSGDIGVSVSRCVINSNCNISVVHSRRYDSYPVSTLSFYMQGEDVSKDIKGMLGIMLMPQEVVEREAYKEVYKEHDNILHDDMHKDFTVWDALLHLDIGYSVMMNASELDTFTSGLDVHNEVGSNFRAYVLAGEGASASYKVCRKHITSTGNERELDLVKLH